MKGPYDEFDAEGVDILVNQVHMWDQIMTLLSEFPVGIRRDPTQKRGWPTCDEACGAVYARGKSHLWRNGILWLLIMNHFSWIMILQARKSRTNVKNLKSPMLFTARWSDWGDYESRHDRTAFIFREHTVRLSKIWPWGTNQRISATVIETAD